MAFVLSLETSTTVTSAALHENGELLAGQVLHLKQAAAAQLSVLINQLFIDTGVGRTQLDAVAVSGGPGSYTGLRIGTATAKGICYALDRPLIAIDSLQVLAASIPQQPAGELLCPMIDARRMEVYCCLLTGSMNVVEDSHPRVIDENSFIDHLQTHQIHFFGNGSAKCKPIITHPHALFIDDAYPKAEAMGLVAFRKFTSGQFADVRAFEPAYLKEFVAKTKKT